MTSNTSFVIAAYAVTWVVIVGYAIRLLFKGMRAEAAFGHHARTAEPPA
jgi:hypothetical protein